MLVKLLQIFNYMHSHGPKKGNFQVKNKEKTKS